MPLDAICLRALKNELSEKLVGMKIDKVQMPERDLIILSLRGNGDSFKLLLSAGVGSARMHITSEKFENPKSPPMFCMLLRKHLQGASILALEQPNDERMLQLRLNTYDELGVLSEKLFILEMIGRSTNFVLVGSDGRIIDCLRRVDYEMSDKRQILPGLIYHLPPLQEKRSFLADDDKSDAFSIMDGEMRADKWLIDNFSGLSPLICRELCARAVGDSSLRIEELEQSQRDSLKTAVLAFSDMVQANEFEAYMLLEDERPREFSFMPIKQYGECMELEKYANFSELIEGFYSRRDRVERMRSRSKELLRSIKNRYDRVSRKLANQREELEKSVDREQLRKNGDLITANMYRIKKGDKFAEVEDFYDENMPTIKISLDFMKTPQQNAAAYFRAYNKAKTAEIHLIELIEQAEREQNYLGSVMDEIERAEGETELGEIRAELTSLGYIRSQKNSKKMKVKESAPRKFVSDNGFEILVGRNNAQNDRLTTRDARRTDLWLHTQKVHGSHVIITCNGEKPDDKTIEQAASLAVYYSQGRSAGKVAVDCTEVRFVKKPSGSLPGKVIYTDYKTIIAEADEKLVLQLAK